MKKLSSAKVKRLRLFGAVLITFTLLSSFSCFAASYQTDIDAAHQFNSAPYSGALYANFGNYFDYYTKLNTTQASSGYLYSLTSDINSNNINYFNNCSLLQLYEYEDNLFFEENYVYSVEITFRIRCDDSSGTTDFYDPDGTRFVLFNDSSIWDDTNPITASSIEDVSFSFACSSCELVNNLYYKMIWNFSIDPNSELAKTNRVNYGSIGGYDLFGYLYHSWALITPGMDLRFVVDQQSGTPITYTSHTRTDLISMSCTKLSSDEYWTGYMDGKFGELSSTIDENTDRILSGDELTKPDVSEYEEQEEIVHGLQDQIIDSLPAFDISFFTDWIDDISDTVNSGASWLGSWLDYFVQHNSFIYILIIAWMLPTLGIYAYRVFY